MVNGNFQFNRLEKNKVFIECNGVYVNQNNKYECKLSVPKSFRSKWNDFEIHVLRPFLYKTSKLIECDCSYIGKSFNSRFYLLIGDDLNQRELAIQKLATRIVPNAPLLEAALQESPYTIQDVQFWSEWSRKKLTNEQIELLKEELKNNLITKDLFWFLSPFFRTIQKTMDLDLFHFLSRLAPHLSLFEHFEGYNLIDWEIYIGKGLRIDSLLSSFSKDQKLMGRIFKVYFAFKIH